jgi:hypothetical protein
MNTAVVTRVHTASADVPSIAYGQLANCGDFRVMEALNNITAIRDMPIPHDETPVTLGDLIISSPVASLPSMLRLFPIRSSLAYYIHNVLVFRVYYHLMDKRARSILKSPEMDDLVSLQEEDLNYLNLLIEKIRLNEERGRTYSSTEFSDVIADIICRGFYPSAFSGKSDKLHHEIFDTLQQNPLPLSATRNFRIKAKVAKKMKTRSLRNLRETIAMRYSVSGYLWFHDINHED